MKKPTEGKVALLSFLEEVEKDKLSKQGPNKTKQLVDYMTSKKTGCDDSEEIPTKVAMKQVELKKGTPNNPRVDEEDDREEDYQVRRDQERVRQNPHKKPGQSDVYDRPGDLPYGKEVDEGQMDEAAFSRQHYQAIADILKEASDQVGRAPVVVDFITQKFIELFKRDNKNFDSNRFEKAVGVNLGAFTDEK
jgi:hypothetical protein